MNYLAHAYLSYNYPSILVGNLIADYVKGKQINLYPHTIQEGILLHREIDSFTDNHPTVKQTKYIFRQSAGRYDASFLDIAYDYFLANSTTYTPAQGWLQFSHQCYQNIDKASTILPSDFLTMYRHMKAENWLYNYRSKDTIKKNFIRFANHLSYLPQKDHSDIYTAFENNIDQLQQSFNNFFPELINHIKSITSK